MRKLILLFCLSIPAFGATVSSTTMQWDMRTTGSNSNSGGYDPGVVSPGTDESQQDSGTAISITLATGTTGTGSPAFTSTTHGPGNTVNVTGGSGCTTGTFEILSQAAGVATFDRTMGTATDVCTGTLGGGWAGPLCTAKSSNYCTAGQILNLGSVSGNTIWFKNGTYTVTVGQVAYSSSPFSVTYSGYYSTHGDITPACTFTAICARPIIQSAGSNVFESAASGITTFTNLEVSITGGTGYGISASPATITNVKFDVAAAGGGLYNSGGPSGAYGSISQQCTLCEFNLSNAGAYGIKDNGGSNNEVAVWWSYFHGTGAAGIWDNNNSGGQKWTVIGCAFSGLTRGIYAQNGGSLYNFRLESSSFYGVTNENVRITNSGTYVSNIANNIFWGGTYGVYLNTGAYVTASNAYGNQGTAARYGLNASPSWAPDITLTASPFTNPGSGDFSLNNTAGGGALLKAAGFPGIMPAGTGYLDIGALQSQAAAGSSIASGAYVQ